MLSLEDIMFAVGENYEIILASNEKFLMNDKYTISGKAAGIVWEDNFGVGKELCLIVNELPEFPDEPDYSYKIPLRLIVELVLWYDREWLDLKVVKTRENAKPQAQIENQLAEMETATLKLLNQLESLKRGNK
jgi:hypothetical protein